MRWIKLGRVFFPDGHSNWMSSHASNPVAEHLDGDDFRIYFSTRDAKNRSSIGFVEISLKQPHKVKSVSTKPVLSPGEEGSFDDSGVSLGCFLRQGEKTYLYYMGWNLGVTVPFRNSIGLAVAEKNGRTFRKYSKAPIMDRSEMDPYSLSYPFVLREGGKVRMWYGSHLRCGPKKTDMDHAIKYAESEDGILFDRDGRLVIFPRGPKESVVVRPWVLKQKNTYRMWYSRRGQFYRLGYAESRDGLRWKRMDAESGLTVSKSGWDSESVCYASLFEHCGKLYVLYNGNGYGRTGFGLAVCT